MSKHNDSTSAYMTHRTLKVLSDEINRVSENINTWVVSLKGLIKIRRTLLGNTKADKDLYLAADAFSKLFYKGHLDSDSDNSETHETVNPKGQVENSTKKDHDMDDDALAAYLCDAVSTEKVAADNPELSKKNMSKMQLAALKVLSDGEKELKEMDDLMTRRRIQMEKDLQNPQPTRPVMFTLDVDKTLDPHTGKPIHEIHATCRQDEDGDILEEVSIDGDEPPAKLHPILAMQQELLSGLNDAGVMLGGVSSNDAEMSITQLENETKNIIDKINSNTNMYPISDAQKESPDMTADNNQPKSRFGVQSPEVLMNVRTPVKFLTPETPEFDPKFGPLYRFTPEQRKKMYYQWFKQATVNVDNQLTDKKVDAETRNRLIREETTRIQNDYLESC